MPLMGYRDSGGHFAVRYVPAFGGWRGKPGRIRRIGRTGRRGGGHGGRSSPEQHSSTQLHVPRARHDRRVREPSTSGDGICQIRFSRILLTALNLVEIDCTNLYMNYRILHTEYF